MQLIDPNHPTYRHLWVRIAIVAVCLGIFTFMTLGIGALLTVPAACVLFVGWFVLTIVAAVKANNGEPYRYPFAIRLVK